MEKKLIRLVYALIGINCLVVVGIAGVFWVELKHAEIFSLFKITQTESSHSDKIQEFSFNDLNGKQVKLGDIKSKVVVLDFWATWCEPCVAMIPFLEKVHQKYKDKDVIILGINLDEDQAILNKFVKEHGIKYPVLSVPDGPENLVVKSYIGKGEHRFSLPTLLILDQNHKIVYRTEGWSTSESKSGTSYEETEVLSTLDKLLKS